MRAKEQAISFKDGFPRIAVPEVGSQSMETNQIRTAKIVRNAPLSQDFMPLGYNREAILDRVARGDTWGFNYGIDPNFTAEANKSGKVNFEQFVRSTTESNGINSNQFIWDPMPELENFPVSGKPEQVSQQYVMYNVNPSWYDTTLQKMHVHKQSAPTAYSAPVETSKSQTVVYQMPVNQLGDLIASNGLLQRLKTWLVGGS